MKTVIIPWFFKVAFKYFAIESSDVSYVVQKIHCFTLHLKRQFYLWDAKRIFKKYICIIMCDF